MNTIEPLALFLFDEQFDQLEVCLPYRRLLTGIPIVAVFQNLRWNSNKTSLHLLAMMIVVPENVTLNITDVKLARLVAHR